MRTEWVVVYSVLIDCVVTSRSVVIMVSKQEFI